MDASPSANDIVAGVGTSDAAILEALFAARLENLEASGLDARTYSLVNIAALVAAEAAPASYVFHVSFALEAGVTPEEILGVLVALNPTVGNIRIVSAAAEIAFALGIELDEEGGTEAPNDETEHEMESDGSARLARDVPVESLIVVNGPELEEMRDMDELMPVSRVRAPSVEDVSRAILTDTFRRATSLAVDQSAHVLTASMLVDANRRSIDIDEAKSIARELATLLGQRTE